jgi:tRNA dimethylallyltransferase
MKPKIIVIVGPTASGKTALSIEVAQKFNGEIISADSRQVYRGMDIGTAKAVPDKQKVKNKKLKPQFKIGSAPKSYILNPIFYSHGIPHHLVDIKDPDEEYTLADFKRDAGVAIEDIAARGKLPIIAGGTGLYISALVDGWELPEIRPDPKLRRKIEGEIRRAGLPAVFQKLIRLDPEAAYIVDPANPRRVVRALEIALVSGEPFSAQRKKTESPYDALKLGVTKPSEVLRERIGKRVDEMVQEGLVKEVRGLTEKYGAKPITFDAIGYREIIDSLESKLTLPEAIELIKKKTWGYAKRQMTWFRKDKEIHWINNAREAIGLVGKFLSS